jgi:L-threonylcarbamoyladenylate synthase
VEARLVELDGADVDTKLSVCAEILRSGGVAAFPTDTVWGIGALARHAAAVERIYAIKGRAHQQPLACLVRDSAAAQGCVLSWPEPVRALTQRHWPGPLTVVLPTNGLVYPAVQRTPKLGLRVPDHPLLLRLLEILAEPLAATSANRSGRPELASLAAVRAELGGELDLIVGGEASLSGRASTVLEWTGTELAVLRQGDVRL